MLSSLILCSLLGTALTGSGDFSYYSQSNWDGECTTGNKQSPININTIDYTRYYTDTFPDLGTQSVTYNSNITMTLMMNVDDEEIIYMPSTWPVGHTNGLKMLQLHFHWGTSSATGSEHKFFNTQYAGEIHLVTRNLDQDAENAQDSYAVLGLFLDELSSGNGTMDTVLDALVEDPNIVSSLDLSNLWPTSTTEIYTYEGGLTTPGCNEMVYWQVLKEPLSVGSSVMEKFRDWNGIGKTYREVQSLGDRYITHRILASDFDDLRSEEENTTDDDDDDDEDSTTVIDSEIPDPIADTCLYDTDIGAYRCYYEKAGAVNAALSSLLLTLTATLLL